MKKIITVFLLAFFLIGCSDAEFKVDDPQQKTSFLIHTAAKADTTSTLYKIYEVDGKMHIVNAETNLVEYEVTNKSGEFATVSILAIVFLTFFVAILAAVNAD